MRELKVALLGTGFMARTHAQRLTAQAGVVVDCVCGTTREKAESFSRDAVGGAARAYAADAFDLMLTERRPDALYVCLPPFAHSGQVERAVAAGVHVFLEKPLALTVGRARSMVDAIERAGVVSQVGYHMRFSPPVRRLKAMIDSGVAGTPTLLQGRYFANALHGPWWRDASRGGGQMLEQAIHLYDLCIHLLGKPASVSAAAGNLLHEAIDGYTIEDTSAAVVRFANGAVASLAASNCAVPTEWTCDFRAVFANVVADVTGLNTATFTTSGGRPAEHFFASGDRPVVERVDEPVDCFLAETQNFLAAVRGQARAVAPAREGLAGVELVTAAVRSAAEGGRPVVP